MRSKLVAVVLIAPAMIAARPLATPNTKMVLTPDTFSPPNLSGAPMPAEHISPHHFGSGVADEGLKRIMEGRDNTLATTKGEIVVHPYRPFADPAAHEKEHEHVELFKGARKSHSMGFRQKVRNADGTERPRPNEHHLGPKIGTPINARDLDNFGVLPRPNGHTLPPKIGTPIDARAVGNSGILPRPNGHILPPKIGTPIDARATADADMLTRPNGQLLSSMNAGVTDNTKRSPHSNDRHRRPMISNTMHARGLDNFGVLPHPNGHIFPPKIGTPIDARSIASTERLPRPNGHLLPPKIGTPINAKRDEPEGLEEFEGFKESGDRYGAKETLVDLPISSDYYPGETPVDVPIPSNYGYEEFDDVEEMPVDLSLPSDYDYEEFDGQEETPVDLPFPSDYDYEEFNDTEEIPVDLPIISDYYPEPSDVEDSRYIPATPGDRNSRRPDRIAGPPYPCGGPVHFNGTGFNTTINGTSYNSTINGTAFNNTINGTAFNTTGIRFGATSCLEEAAGDLDESSESALKRRDVAGGQGGARKKQEQERKARKKNPKGKNGGAPGKIDEQELFDYFRDPFNKPSPFNEEYPEMHKPKPKDIYAETGFDQGEGWKTDYWQNGLWDQPRVLKAHKPYWTEGRPVY
ncbi:hypothetical protein V491_02455 [Pseudogymnoascus sp. VKM F-3775]|nr:hypothetical protein V491_02455 [Pseudogymnoascus sp. VKM F-3775]